MLRGERTDKVRERGHETLSTFGIGAELEATVWHALLRQLVAQGLIEVAHDRYGVLELTAAARPVLRGERPLTLAKARLAPVLKAHAGGKSSRDRRRVAARGSADTTAQAIGLDSAASARFKSLRLWRLDTARAHGVPPYVIFNDVTLAEVARRVPADLEALREVPGVGAIKLERYGEAMLVALNKNRVA